MKELEFENNALHISIEAPLNISVELCCHFLFWHLIVLEQTYGAL